MASAAEWDLADAEARFLTAVICFQSSRFPKQHSQASRSALGAHGPSAEGGIRASASHKQRPALKAHPLCMSPVPLANTRVDTQTQKENVLPGEAQEDCFAQDS